MFGLLNPGRQDLLYRRAYARCCQHQRRRYGLPSLTFLSYESILLYLCAADAGKVALEELPAVTCCKLRRLPPRTPVAEQEIARFCSSVGMLLAYIKLSDDLRDRPTWMVRLANWILRRRFREMFDYFRRLDPAFELRVGAFIGEHLQLEKRSEPAPLSEYVRPTARAFGYVFSLFARLPGMEAHSSFLTELGERVGSTIIAFDCAVDRDKDRRRGQYNPLADGDKAIGEAFALCRQQLHLAALASRRHFGEASHTGRVLEQVAERIPHGCTVPACQRFQTETKGVLQRWGIGRRRGVQLNSGLDVVIGIIAFIGVCIGGLACLNVSARQAKAEQARRAAEVAQAKAADSPPDPNAPPIDPADAAATASTGSKKGSGCGGCECCCCDDACGNFACCTVDAATQGTDCSSIDCSGCEGCGNCDCNCN